MIVILMTITVMLQQSTEMGMIVNGRKTKEMLIGSVLLMNPPIHHHERHAGRTRHDIQLQAAGRIRRDKPEVGLACRGMDF